MRFIDSNVFLYALIKPRREVPRIVVERKEKAKKILLRVQGGEEVATTIVHLSEVANIIESRIGLLKSIEFLKELLFAENIHVYSVTVEDYVKALLLAEEKEVSVNDALAYIKMKENNINEIYTFDKHFLKLDVVVVEE